MRSRGGRSGKPAPVQKEPDSADAAYAEAVRRLARQPQSRAILRQRLLRAGFTEDAVDDALEQAQRHGYLDDREYAQALVRRRASSRGHGLIAQELRAKGVAESAAGSALAQIDPEAEAAQALAVARNLLGHRRFADGEAMLNFLAPKLSRRGFGSGVVYRLWRQLATERETARLFDEKDEHN